MSVMEQKMQADMQKEGIMSVNDMIRRNRDADEEDRLDKFFDIEAVADGDF